MTGKAADGTTVTPIRQKMIDQMQIAGLAESTRATYIGEIEQLAKHYMTSPADLDADQLRAWVLSGIERGLKPATTNITVAALKFLYVDTLGCPERVVGLRARKKPRQLPRYMTEEEVERLILATPDLRYRAAFVTAYGAGLRISETLAVKVGDIKSDKKLLHIPLRQGRHRTDGPAAERGHRLPARLLQEHLAAAGNLAVLRRLARPAHRDGDPAPCLQEGARAGRHRQPLQLPLPASFGGDPSS